MKRANEGTMLIPQCETTGCLALIGYYKNVVDVFNKCGV